MRRASPEGPVGRAPHGGAPGGGVSSTGWARLRPATRHFPVPMSWAKIWGVMYSESMLLDSRCEKVKTTFK